MACRQKATSRQERSAGLRAGPARDLRDGLPDGWVTHRDPESGNLFYFHPATNKSQWEKPQQPRAYDNEHRTGTGTELLIHSKEIYPPQTARCTAGCGRIQQSPGRLERCCRDCRGQGAHGPHTQQCDNAFQVAQDLHARNYFGERLNAWYSPKEAEAMSGEATKVLITGNVSKYSNRGIKEWLKPVLPNVEAKASTPPFNISEGRYDFGVQVEHYDAMCFGPQVTEALGQLLELKGIKRTAQRLGARLPVHTINEFVKERLRRVEEMLQSLPADLLTPQHAVDKLWQFLRRIRQLRPDDVGTTQALVEILDSIVGHGWKQKLRVSGILPVFGFRQEVSDRIIRLQHPQDEQMNWGDYAVKWLAKGFGVFGYTGSPADVVNLIHIMMKEPHHVRDNDHSINVVNNFVAALENGRLPLSSMWIPTHMVHDAELDDLMSWVLLYHVRVTVCEKEPPKVLVQLPGYDEFYHLQHWFQNKPSVRGPHSFFFDPAATNMKAVRLWWGTDLHDKDLYVVSERDVRCFVGRYKGKVGYRYVGVHTEGAQKGEKNGRTFRRLGDGKWAFSLKAPPKDKGPDGKNKWGRSWLLMSATTSANKPHDVQNWLYLDVAENFYNWMLREIRLNASISEQPPDDVVPDRKAKWVTLKGRGFEMKVASPICTQPGCSEFAVADGLTRCETHRQRTLPSNENCPMYKEALAFIKEVLPDLEPFRWPKRDRCYCQSCYPPDKPDREIQAEEGNYIIPRNWVGIAIAIPEEERARVFNWDVVFHGTMADRVMGILQHRRIAMPGDRLPDGSILRSINSAGRDDACYYTSPTINYAGLQLYATAKPWDWGEKATQVVLQCRQDTAGIVQRSAETMGFGDSDHYPYRYQEFDVCAYTSLYDHNAGIELISNMPDRCIPYRIMLRTFPGHKARGGAKPPTRELHPQNKETFRSRVDRPAGLNRPDSIPYFARWY